MCLRSSFSGEDSNIKSEVKEFRKENLITVGWIDLSLKAMTPYALPDFSVLSFQEYLKETEKSMFFSWLSSLWFLPARIWSPTLFCFIPRLWQTAGLLRGLLSTQPTRTLGFKAQSDPHISEQHKSSRGNEADKNAGVMANVLTAVSSISSTLQQWFPSDRIVLYITPAPAQAERGAARAWDAGGYTPQQPDVHAGSWLSLWELMLESDLAKSDSAWQTNRADWVSRNLMHFTTLVCPNAGCLVLLASLWRRGTAAWRSERKDGVLLTHSMTPASMWESSTKNYIHFLSPDVKDKKKINIKVSYCLYEIYLNWLDFC